MSIIVNADDFGISESVNAAIKESFDKGLIGRTTLMTNMPCAAEAMELASKEGFDDKIGLHFNLTQGKPLTEAMAGNRVMCNEAGEFTAEFARNMKTRFFLDAKTTKCVEDELIAQIEEYKRLGGKLWHLDSHHHVHTNPSIWRVVRRVVKRYPFTSVRLGRNMYRGGNVAMHIYKMLLNRSINKALGQKEELFGSMKDYVSYTSGMDEKAKSDFIDNRKIEVMVHPMYDNEGKLTDSRKEFLTVL